MPPVTRLARRRRFHRPGFAPDALTFTPDGLVDAFDLEVVLGGPIDPASGMIRDVAEVDDLLAAALAHHQTSSETPATLETLARVLFEDLRERVRPARLDRLRLAHGPDLWVDVWP